MSTTIGQTNAVRALELGIRIDSPGYNTFITGLSGSGRTHAVEQLLARLPTPNRRREDRVFVHNFEEASRPRLLSFSPGRAVAFKASVEEMVQTARDRIPQLFEEDTYLQQRRAITERAQAEEAQLLKALEARVRDDGFAIVTMPGAPKPTQAILPVVEGTAIPIDALKAPGEAREKLKAMLRRQPTVVPPDEAAFEAMVDRAIEDFELRNKGHLRAAEEAAKEARRLVKRTTGELVELERSTVRASVEGLLADLKAEWSGPEVTAHLDAMLEHMMAHPWVFAPPPESESAGRPQEFSDRRQAALSIYGVNVIQECGGDQAPVVVERHPTFTNLFGTIEREVRPSGDTSTDFSKIQAGSLLRADGGFLIMYARDVLLESGVWRNLMRILRSRQLEIQRPDSLFFFAPSAMKPEAIDIDVKLILIGDERFYQMLSFYEEDFLKVFKVKAEFDTTTDRDDRGVSEFADVMRSIQTRESLRPISADGFAALAEQAARLGGHRDRLSTRFGDLGDVLREADYWSQSEGRDQIDRVSVETAVAEDRARHQLISHKLSREILEEVILIDTDGQKVGQINGLAVYGLGRHHFGRPSRITASVGAGRGGLINIEREAHLSGPTHDKGILILGGYLRATYGGRMPLALTGSIAFEQSYGGVDGDSASLAELYALLSAISGSPIRQSIAVTGSVNQKGEVQAIGGANEKVEGFFDIAAARGLAGHGCVIPLANRRHLMLDQRVVEAAAEGTFSVWAVDSVDDGIPILFGMPSDALHAAVRKSLEELAGVAGAEPSVQKMEPAVPHRAEPPPRPEAPPAPGPVAKD